MIPDRLAAGLAALLFAIDEGHSYAVGWISSRNTVLAGMFGLAALLSHVQARKRRSRALHGASATWLALALCSAEAGVTSLAHLIAYASTREAGTLRARITSLAPQLGVFLIWAAWYITHHHGMHGSGLYRELEAPGPLVSGGLLDLPLWLLSLLGPSLISLAITVPPAEPRLFALLLVAPLLSAVALRWKRLRSYDLFGLIALLCIPPLFTTVPQDRLLFSASFGAFGVIAGFMRSVTVDGGGLGARAARGAFIFCHLVLAPLLFIPILGGTLPLQRASEDVAAQLSVTPPDNTVLLNAPLEVLPMYAFMIYRNRHAGPPQPLHLLYAGGSPLALVRLDERTLEVTAQPRLGRRAIRARVLQLGIDAQGRRNAGRRSAESTGHEQQRARAAGAGSLSVPGRAQRSGAALVGVGGPTPGALDHAARRRARAAASLEHPQLPAAMTVRCDVIAERDAQRGVSRREPISHNLALVQSARVACGPATQAPSRHRISAYVHERCGVVIEPQRLFGVHAMAWMPSAISRVGDPGRLDVLSAERDGALIDRR